MNTEWPWNGWKPRINPQSYYEVAYFGSSSKPPSLDGGKDNYMVSDKNSNHAATSLP